MHKLPEKTKEFVEENEEISLQSLNKPCQVVMLDFNKPNPTCFVILHKAEYPDMLTIIFEKVAIKDLSFKATQDPRLLELLGQERTENLVREIKRKVQAARKDRYWSAKSEPLDSINGFLLFHREIPSLGEAKYELSDIMFRHMTFNLDLIMREKQKEKIEETVSNLKRDAELIPENFELRTKIIENTQRLDSQFKQLDEQYKKLRDELIGIRKLVGTETYGEWKVLVSEIDKINTRIDGLSDIRSAYDKVLAQQNAFMKQQSEVMKQQSSFITWVKYATILVPIAVVSVPVIEILLRHFLGIP